METMPPVEIHIFVDKDGRVTFSDLPKDLLSVVAALEGTGGSGHEGGNGA